MKRPSKKNSRLILTHLEARYKRITGEIWITATNRTMINHFASRVNAANARARVHAFAILAGAIWEAVRADGAFRATIRRGPNKCGQTRTYCLTVQFATLTVKPAGRKTARILFYR